MLDIPAAGGNQRPSKDGFRDDTLPVRKRLDILLIEDQADTARVLSGLLGTEHRVRVARTVAEAKQLSEQHRFDLVISDLGLPDGTGFEFLRWLRGRQLVPAIALSGFGAEQDVRRSLEAGFVGHLTKPVDLKRLRAILSRF